MKQRIWELDAMRGICILGMVFVHLFYDLTILYSVVELKDPTLFNFLRDWGAVPFFLISGICATLGSRPVRRGLMVLGGGLIVTAVTVGMYFLNFSEKNIIIYFGVLHCLGLCMMLWPLFRKLPTWLLAILGWAIIFGGLHLVQHPRVDFPWLLPLGIYPYDFASSDYFPLLPNLGYFLLGAVLGKTLYRRKKSLLPWSGTDPISAFFRFCGKHSLLIYLLHQPLTVGLIQLFFILKKGSL